MKSSSRKFMGYIALAIVCVMVGSGLGLYLKPEAQAEEPAVTPVIVTSPFTAAIAKVRDSVVGVNNYQMVSSRNNSITDWSNYFGFGFGFGNDWGNNDRSITKEEKLYATGSGVVVADKYVLTNHHVIENATSVKVSVWSDDNAEPTLLEATVVACDEEKDIAVLNVPELTLKPVELGDSDTLQVGDWAICIGNPLSETFSRTVTAGIVSGLNRGIDSTSYDKYGRRETITNTMIQVDAAINSGNSGGGMFNVLGQLMGIPTLKYSSNGYSSSASIESIGMCIPINVAKGLIEDVLNGTVAAENKAAEPTAAPAGSGLTGKPRMGITITSINTSSALVQNGTIPNGVYVSEVEAGGPAAIAGMESGDIIVDVNDTVITSVSQLQEIIGDLKEGDKLQVKVFRITNEDTYEGEYVDLQIILAIVDAIAQ